MSEILAKTGAVQKLDTGKEAGSVICLNYLCGGMALVAACSIASGMPWPHIALKPHFAITPTINPPTYRYQNNPHAGGIHRRTAQLSRKLAIKSKTGYQTNQCW
ncbi:hypothetical protein [Tatumella sp. UBA2305]|uniref:hypothetical protein n=1 Tax=Tatumella sp. UBA2305 TaxID=1947647 RepID=UPI0025D6EC68|nr:hypothetical protein [Tatumella sp. UBA2305]